MLCKYWTQYASKLKSSAVATRLEKVSFHSNSKERHAKECSNYCTIALISHASKVMLKILQASLQQYVNHELADIQAGFRKGRRTRDQIASIRSVQFSCSVMSNSLRPHESQHARPPCASPTPGVHSNACPSNR